MSLIKTIDQNQSCHWISSDAFALQTQACDDLLAHYHCSREDAQKHDVDTIEQWPNVQAQLSQPSLFHTAQVHIIRLNVKGFPLAHQAHLKTLMNGEQSSPVIMMSAALEKKTQQTKWFKTLQTHCQFLPLPLPKGRQYVQWLIDYVAKHNNTLATDLAQQMAQCYEGHLDAAKQLLDQCLTRYPSTPLTVDNCTPYLQEGQRWEGFALCDALLAGQKTRAHAIFLRLKQQDDALLLLLWFIRQPLEWVLSPKQAPYFKQRDITQAQRRWSNTDIFSAFSDLSRIEHQFKTQPASQAWQPLEQLILKLTRL